MGISTIVDVDVNSVLCTNYEWPEDGKDIADILQWIVSTIRTV